MAKLVSKTYGDALFAVAKEEGRLDEFYEAAKVVANILREHVEFAKLMNHPEINKADKLKVVEETFSGNVPQEFVGLMSLMVEKNRANDLLAVFEYFSDLVKEEKKIGKADVTTAVELTQEQKEKVEKKLLETTKYETFEMGYHLDETLIGGMVIRVGDRVVDSSIKTKLYDLSRQLRNTTV